MPDNDPDDPEANDTLTTDTEVIDTTTAAAEDPVEAGLEPALEPELESELEADLAADTDPEAEGGSADYEEEFIPPAERPVAPTSHRGPRIAIAGPLISCPGRSAAPS